MEKEIAPIMAEYWEKSEFPFHAIPKLASLGIAGGTIKGYGCPGLSITASAVTMAEMARVDIYTRALLSCDALCGSEAQKHKYLPSLAQLTAVGCWALTEPNYGSDACSLRTTATKVSTSHPGNGTPEAEVNVNEFLKGSGGGSGHTSNNLGP